jgi:hypothetical protein
MMFLGVLGQVAPIINDIITIYSYSEEVNTSVPIVIEEIKKVFDMMSQREKYLVHETNMNTNEGDLNTSNQAPL